MAKQFPYPSELQHKILKLDVGLTFFSERTFESPAVALTSSLTMTLSDDGKTLAGKDGLISLQKQ